MPLFSIDPIFINKPYMRCSLSLLILKREGVWIFYVQFLKLFVQDIHIFTSIHRLVFFTLKTPDK